MQQIGTMTKNHNQSKCRVVVLSPSKYIYNTLPHLSLREYFEGGDRKNVKSQIIREFAVRLCLLVMSTATPIKSHQHDGLNVN